MRAGRPQATGVGTPLQASIKPKAGLPPGGIGQKVSVPADIGPGAQPAGRRGQLPLATAIVTFR